MRLFFSLFLCCCSSALRLHVVVAQVAIVWGQFVGVGCQGKLHALFHGVLDLFFFDVWWWLLLLLFLFFFFYFPLFGRWVGDRMFGQRRQFLFRVFHALHHGVHGRMQRVHSFSYVVQLSGACFQQRQILVVGRVVVFDVGQLFLQRGQVVHEVVLRRFQPGQAIVAGLHGWRRKR